MIKKFKQFVCINFKRQGNSNSNDSSADTIDRTTVPGPNIFHDQNQTPNQKSNSNLCYYYLSPNTVDLRRNTVAYPTYVANSKNNNTVEKVTDDPTKLQHSNGPTTKQEPEFALCCGFLDQLD